MHNIITLINLQAINFRVSMNGRQQMQTDTTIVPADIEWLDSFPDPILMQVYTCWPYQLIFLGFAVYYTANFFFFFWTKRQPHLVTLHNELLELKIIIGQGQRIKQYLLLAMRLVNLLCGTSGLLTITINGFSCLKNYSSLQQNAYTQACTSVSIITFHVYNHGHV